MNGEWPITLPALGTSAEDCSWNDIAKICAAGKAKEYFRLGDTKSVTIVENGVEKTFLMEIVSFDADTKADGTKAAISWISVEVVTMREMNETKTNDGAWEGSDLRSWLQSDFYSLLPADLQDAIVVVNKTYMKANTENGTCQDSLWIPSSREVTGDTSKEKSGATYSSYITSDMLKKANLDGAKTNWWLRTTNARIEQFSIVQVSFGFIVNSDADFEQGVVLGFCT